MKPDIAGFLPLSPATLHILLALAAEDLHGYGIMQEVTRQTDGAYKIGPGTLYDNLQRLMDQGIVKEKGQRDTEDARRRYYTLTSLGRGVLSAEVNRLEGVIRHARLHIKRPVLRSN